MKLFKLEIWVTVSQNWIEDGFEMSEREDEIKEAFANMLPHAYEHEVKTEIKSILSHQYKNYEAESKRTL